MTLRFIRHDVIAAVVVTAFFCTGCTDDEVTEPDGYAVSAGATVNDQVTIQAFSAVPQAHLDAVRDGLTHITSVYPISTRLHVVVFMTESFGASTIGDNLCATLYETQDCARRSAFVEGVEGAAEDGQQATRFLDGKAVVYFRIGPDEENANLIRAVSMHEYFHVYQDENSQKEGNPSFPGWFDEGLAAYIGWSQADAKGWTNDRHDEWENLNKTLETARALVASEDLELTPDFDGDGVYVLGILAVDYLLYTRNLSSETLFTEVARDAKEAGFEASFESNIGLSLGDFVTAFNAHLEQTAP